MLRPSQKTRTLKLALELVSDGSDPYEDLMLDELRSHREKELKQAISTLDERTKDIFSRWLRPQKILVRVSQQTRHFRRKDQAVRTGGEENACSSLATLMNTQKRLA